MELTIQQFVEASRCVLAPAHKGTIADFLRRRTFLGASEVRCIGADGIIRACVDTSSVRGIVHATPTALVALDDTELVIMYGDDIAVVTVARQHLSKLPPVLKKVVAWMKAGKSPLL
jgi:hypothetical protein